jgi:hypothetical protein
MPRKSTKRLRDCTRKEIITRLNRRGTLPPETIAAIATRIIDKRKAEKKAAKAYARHKDKWKPIIEPLAKEIRLVQSRMVHFKKRENIQLSTFYGAYLDAMLKMRDILKAYQKQELSPDERAREAKLTDEGILPNSLARLSIGCHWSDWVPFRIRTEFRRAHANLAQRTKPVAPIFQRDPPKTILAQHANVKAKWTEELNLLLNVVERDGTDKRPLEAEQAALIQIAIKKLDTVKKDRRVTPHWRKLVTGAERIAVQKTRRQHDTN